MKLQKGIEHVVRTCSKYNHILFRVEGGRHDGEGVNEAASSAAGSLYILQGDSRLLEIGRSGACAASAVQGPGTCPQVVRKSAQGPVLKS